MKKTVNVSSATPLYIFTPPLTGTFKNVELTSGDIRNAILQGAKVEELVDGTLVQLTLANYDKVTVVEVPEATVSAEPEPVKPPEKVVINEPGPVDTDVDTDAEKVTDPEESEEVVEKVEEVDAEVADTDAEEASDQSDETVPAEEPKTENNHYGKNHRKEKRR